MGLSEEMINNSHTNPLSNGVGDMFVILSIIMLLMSFDIHICNVNLDN
jgi:hypothetical protein